MFTTGHDIGYIGENNNSNNNINLENRVEYSTIYRETHEINNTNRSDFISRSYISFSFGGKNIEDFELIVTNQGMMQRNLTGAFSDLTNNYDVIDGQFYWGTYFINNQLNLTLSTDSMTQKHLDDFINWFKPGQVRELILAEHPNRAIMARVATPPSISVIPFKEQTVVKIGNTDYETLTALYKGDITLTFIMDSPFWYSKSNLLVESNNNVITQWEDGNGVLINNINADMARIILEDRIVPMEAIPNNINKVFGDRFIYRNSNNIDIINNSLLGIENNENLTSLFNFNSGLSLNNNEEAYVFYGGTAPVKPIIQFTVVTECTNEVNEPYKLIKFPCSSFTKNNHITNSSYNEIILEGEEKQILKICAPNAFTSYNQAQWCIYNATSYKNLRELLNDNVSHYHALRWASRIVDYMERFNIPWENETSGELASTRLKTLMSYFLINGGSSKYVIDNNTGHAYAKLSYRKIIDGQILPSGDIFPSGDPGWETYGEQNNDIEDVSDIIQSNYIELKERNHLNANGKITTYNSNDKTAIHKIYHTFSSGLTNVAVLFKNMYY